jgi:endonuclease/exonuclease/phosphatase family metal-dependent hydrolase
MVLATLVSVAGDGLIGAGDYNETLTGDLDGETWSREYRKRMRAAGLSDVLLDAWSHETPTRFPSDGSQALQLDHVVVDAVGRALARAEPQPHRDAFWDDFAVAGCSARQRSDHAAVWFHLTDVGDP